MNVMEKFDIPVDPNIKAKSFGGAMAQAEYLIHFRLPKDASIHPFRIGLGARKMTPASDIGFAIGFARKILELGGNVEISPIHRE